MRSSLWVRGVGLVLAGVVTTTSAQSYRPTTQFIPRSTGHSQYSIPQAVPPGCGTPVMPVPTVPYSSSIPSSPTTPVRPYAPGNLPSTATPSPSTSGAPSAMPSTSPTTPSFSTPGAGAGAGAGAGMFAAATAAESRGESGSGSLASAAPQMIGDLIGGGWGYSGRSSSGTRIPLANRSGVKIADNESPRPMDRFFGTYNYFNTVNTFGDGTFGLHRGLIGFEKTFLEGDASFGMRLPYLWGRSDAGVDGIGLLSLIGKYAFYNDPCTGDIISGGLAVAVPLGNTFSLPDGTDLDSVLIQPWGGFIYGMDDLYAHGFTSVIIPTQSNDVLLYTADVGVGYWLYQGADDAFLTAIIPTVEGHANVPLSNASRSDPVYFPTLVSITAGAHFGLGSGCWLTLAGGVPVTGPNLYDFEAFAQFNFRY